MSAIQEVDSETKSKLVNLCGEYLSEAWIDVNQDDIVCKVISLGFANKTYYCSIGNCQIPQKYGDVNPKEVILHTYGSGLFSENNALKFNGEAAEAVMLHLLSEIGMYPKLYGVFPGGRIEEYISSQVATVDELNSLDLSKAVIRRLAKIHSLNLPISKKPNLLEKMGAVMQSAGEPSLNEFNEKFSKQEQIMLQNIFNFGIAEQVAWIASIVPKINHRVICSHNDMNVNNILLKDKYTSNDDRVLIIDYEMCRYFFRGYDIAYFLRMKKSRLGLQDGKITLTEEKVDESKNDLLLDEYLKTFAEITKQYDPKYDTIDHLKMEIQLFDLLYDCMLIGYAMAAVKNAPIALEYVDWVATNFDTKKNSLIRKYGDIFEHND